jgi:dipeptidyl aminopeptidase/acylaminoacyl peptidase
MHNLTTLLTLLFFTSILTSQLSGQKKMDYTIYSEWNSLSNSKLSDDGNWVAYNIKPAKGDSKLYLVNTNTKKQTIIERAGNATFDKNGAYAFALISPPYDTIQAKKRAKIDKKKMPKDTLAIIELASLNVTKIDKVKDYEAPKEWGDYIVFHKEARKDTTKNIKKESKKNGSTLYIHQLSNQKTDSIRFVTSYVCSEEEKIIAAVSTGIDSTEEDQVLLYHVPSNKKNKIIEAKGKYKKLNFSKKGKHLAFLQDIDTTKSELRPYKLHLWSKGQLKSKIIVDESSNRNGEDYFLSENANLNFSDDEKRLFYGIAPAPIVQDTNLLPEEIVSVEVWTYTDKLLYTQQENNLDSDKKKTYDVIYDINKRKQIPLLTKEESGISYPRKRNSNYAIIYNQKPYAQTISWLGYAARDLSIVNLSNGEKKTFASAEIGFPRISPDDKYGLWYNSVERNWKSVELSSAKVKTITNNAEVSFYNERHDSPSEPRPYGFAFWTKEDKNVVIYDRYDLWKVDPSGKKKPERLTDGRSSKTVYRYVQIDDEAYNIPTDSTVLVEIFKENNKDEGLAYLNLKTKEIKLVEQGAYTYNTRRIAKAKNADRLIFTKESFRTYPDLILTNSDFTNQRTISNTNPQQSEYAWGDISLYKWTSPDGTELEGLLLKPDNFDPNKKYPMIVNFYERSSDRLHRHRAPAAGRSTINYSYYANKGYVIFNPDVVYKIGYPGKSAYNAVISGVESLKKEAWLDHDRIGVQGHSWGGYQIAHLITKTDIFKCAEAGAPVVNMTSAYGGIRWGSGMSRMFQYEKTQSRIGATLWEKPELYIENSPLFNTPDVNTPVLILHNDADGAVPWYQGIEYFVALRRLNKPAWLLNYNDEPHWPVKWQNRVDFNRRLEQFFDHYLMDKPMPSWMKNGVSPIKKGIRQGIESDK